MSDEQFHWTREAILRLTELYRVNDDTATTIAQKLVEEFGGKLSKNGVIGKIHRLGLQSPPEKKRKIKKDALDDASELSGSLMCQWPHGHPGDEDFHFCREETVPGKPYCKKHSSLAYIKADKGKEPPVPSHMLG